MICFPPAKINIGLWICDKRRDGYHTIASLMVPVPLCDILEILPSTADSFRCSGIPVDGVMHDNLVLKARDLMRTSYDLPGLYIHLHKNIPTGAGLGGGSSDAASTIVLLDQMFSLKLSDEQKNGFAAMLGSDCPFFVKPQPAFVSGRGEILEPANVTLEGYYLVIVKPFVGVSTSWAYSRVKPVRRFESLKSVASLPVHQWQEHLRNDFETVVFPTYPEIKAIRDRLLSHGAIYASLSGSGSAVFGLFREDPGDMGLDGASLLGRWLM